MSVVTLEDFAKHLRRPAFTTADDESLRAQQHLTAAEAVVASRCGLVGDGEQQHVVYPSGRQLVLPVWGRDLRVVAVLDPDGRPVGVDPVTSRLHAGVVGVGVTRPGPWSVTVSTGDGSSWPEELRLAALIIAAHLWETQQGRSARPQAFPGADERPSGMGYAIPNRAAELMAAHTLPTVA